MTNGYPDWTQSRALGNLDPTQSYLITNSITTTSTAEATIFEITARGILRQVSFADGGGGGSEALWQIYFDGEVTPSFSIDYETLINTLTFNGSVQTANWGVQVLSPTAQELMWFVFTRKFNTSMRITVTPDTTNSSMFGIIVQYSLLE